MTQIASKIHEGFDLLRRKDGYLKEEPAKLFGEFPPYVISPRIREMFEVNDLLKMAQAMIAAGKDQLPFPTTVIELWEGSPWRECFAVQNIGQGRYAIVQWLFGILPPADNYPPNLIPGQLATSNATSDDYVMLAFSDKGWTCNRNMEKNRDEREIVEHCLQGLVLALLINNMPQLERHHVDPVKLNKARVRSGKSPISSHTVIRLGYVYDREGRKVPLTEANRTMPIHLRAGHMRNQPHGDAYRAAHPEVQGDSHPVWIPPILVNYKDGDAVPVPKPRIVRP